MNVKIETYEQYNADELNNAYDAFELAMKQHDKYKIEKMIMEYNPEMLVYCATKGYLEIIKNIIGTTMTMTMIKIPTDMLNASLNNNHMNIAIFLGEYYIEISPFHNPESILYLFQYGVRLDKIEFIKYLIKMCKCHRYYYYNYNDLIISLYIDIAKHGLERMHMIEYLESITNFTKEEYNKIIYNVTWHAG